MITSHQKGFGAALIERESRFARTRTREVLVARVARADSSSGRSLVFVLKGRDVLCVFVC